MPMTKTTYSEQMQKIVAEYRSAGNSWPATTHDIAAWAVRTGKWHAPRELAIDRCADDLARAMREEFITDRQGRRVRAKHAARQEVNGEQQTFWAVYADFEKERDSNMSARLSLLKQYTDNFATLTDADVVRMVNESAEIQKQTLDLRMKYFGILTQKLGAKPAARFAHIDDYLTTLFRLGMLDNMPALSAGGK